EAVPHALRHTFCSKLVQLGVQIKVVQELAGHESIETTLRYAHLAPRNLRSAIDLLNGPADPSLNLVA
ncbi:MAG: tyrosine-type recombinase/integrase, partial [Candidatus Thalassarchaeaceae archaeon]|nr:tyrosine-type recombinase/integrase [Candidatus Thalassarchaeaceae archaeon]